MVVRGGFAINVDPGFYNINIDRQALLLWLTQGVSPVTGQLAQRSLPTACRLAEPPLPRSTQVSVNSSRQAAALERPIKLL
jgi:hypothetical protein